MFRKNEFLAEVARKELTLRRLSDFIGINSSTLYRKINGESEFTRSEISAICECLRIDDERMREIFFN